VYFILKREGLRERKNSQRMGASELFPTATLKEEGGRHRSSLRGGGSVGGGAVSLNKRGEGITHSFPRRKEVSEKEGGGGRVTIFSSRE